MEKRARAFTLIELLLVIAIISILVAMLLPTLQKSKEQSKRAVCMGHQRQVATALLLIGEDNDGWINGINVATTNATPTGTNLPSYWIHIVTNYLGNNSKIVGFNRDAGCPSKNGITYAFGANTLLTGHGYYPMHSLREVRHASRIFLVADCYYYLPNYGTHFEYTMDRFVAGGWDFHPRHRGEGLNFVFIDGHGEFLKNVSGAFVGFGPNWPADPWWSIPGATQWWPASAWGTGIWGE
jgi:prepilin-type N-terminal cleavage/methylation domain-containing protein/prepilin-type processing-associated H-X9-DG protein